MLALAVAPFALAVLCSGIALLIAPVVFLFMEDLKGKWGR